MGATFDRDLIYQVGQALAAEAKEKSCNILLGPTVCLQRSPLLGRGFEAFSEDPYLSGVIASGYVDGVQKSGVGCSLKHYVAHDQSTDSTEDDVRASERTLREMHLLPFQIVVKNADPWSIMTAYNKVNGIHVPEHAWLLNHILREDWAWEGVTVSDWCGTYSCSEAINAGLDLEMPGPSRWRGDLLRWSVTSNKVQKRTLDKSVRRVLQLVKKAHPGTSLPAMVEVGDSAEKQELCQRVAAQSIVLLKNDKEVLPLDQFSKCSYGLIGPAVHHPAISGGGSADLPPYHVSTPYEAFAHIVGKENITTAVGCRCKFV
jgi:beta-glucosidase